MSFSILFVVHVPADPRAAVYRVVSDRAGYLRRLGHDVDVWTADDLAGARWARVHPIVLPLALVGRDLARYDAVVFHSYLGWAHHLMRRLGRRRRPATATWFHGLEPICHRAVEEELARDGRRLSRRFRLMHSVLLPRLLRFTCRVSDVVFCLNRAEARYLVAERWTEANQVRLVSNGVEPSCFLTRRYRRTARRLLFVGQWLPRKGIRHLVAAFTNLVARADVELACVGTSAPAAEVLAAFPSSVRSRVSVRPRVDREELYQELVDADVFLFPTLAEGFSCALVEAMAAGLPIVTTPVGAAPDLLEDGRSALLVVPADADGLSRAVCRLLPDQAGRERLGAAARVAAGYHTMDAVDARFAALVLQMVERRRGGTSARLRERGDVAC